MTAEANIAILVEKSGVVFVVHGIRIFLSAVGSHIMSLASLANVAIGNNFSVHGNGNTVANGTNFLGVPSVLLKGDVLWHADSVNRAVHLIRLQTGINRIVMVENLNLHSVISSVAADVCTYAHAVVYARGFITVVKAINDIAILFLGIKITASAIVGCYENSAVVGSISGGISLPIIERTTIKQYFETGFLLLVRKSIDRS